MKKITRLFLLSVVLTLFFTTNPVYAQTMDEGLDEKIQIEIFERSGCSHCVGAKEFLSELKSSNQQLEITYRDLADDGNKEVFDAVTDKYGIVKSTPLILVNGYLIQGFGSDETTGKTIQELVAGSDISEINQFEKTLDLEAQLLVGGSYDYVCSEDEFCTIENEIWVTIPLFNKTINVGDYSLPVMSIVLGFIDGFNPCAMWVLIMFLAILSQLKSRRKMLLYAGVFIFAEAIMYYLILNVWLTVWDFIELDQWVTPLVGLLAVGSGIYFLYKFKTFKPECSVTNLDQRQKISQKTKELAAKPLTIGVFLGILGLAFSVNVFEFACSIGIPQTFTKVLELNYVTWLGTQFYMALYILMYMIDDFIVFGLALYSFDKIGLTHQYSKWSTLVGGLLMLFLGLLLLMRPEWLVF